MPYDDQKVLQPRRDVAAVRFRAGIPEIGSRLGEAFGAVERHLAKHGIPLEGPVAYYEPAGDELDVAAGFEVSAPIKGDGHVVPTSSRSARRRSRHTWVPTRISREPTR